jgi:hypothetical protein
MVFSGVSLKRFAVWQQRSWQVRLACSISAFFAAPNHYESSLGVKQLL